MAEVKVVWTCDYSGHNSGEVSGLSEKDASEVLGKYAAPFLERVAVTKSEEAPKEEAPKAGESVAEPVAPSANVAEKQNSQQVVNSPKGRRNR